MEPILRAAAIYLFLLVIFRLSGKRTLAQITTFDFIMLLIMSEATQNAMVGQDSSLTTCFLAILTLVGLEIGLSKLKEYSPRLEKILDGVPTIIVEKGKPLRDRLDQSRVDEFDVLAAARELHGLERMEQIKYAILERDGKISIIPN